MKAEDSINKKFGRLTVIRLLAFDKFHNRKVLCLCDCGKEKAVVFYRLKCGDTQSCGCLAKENAHKQLILAVSKNPKLVLKTDPRMASAKIVYKSRYADGNLLFEQFLELSQQDCYYCGGGPSNKFNYCAVKNSRYSAERQLTGYFTYNGLDRINNSYGHDINNVVPCCITCNKAKLHQNKDDFFIWITKVYIKHIKE